MLTVIHCHDKSVCNKKGGKNTGKIAARPLHQEFGRKRESHAFKRAKTRGGTDWCVHGGHKKLVGLVGPDASAESRCNLCVCKAGGKMQCQHKRCSTRQGKICAHTSCSFRWSFKYKKYLMAVTHHHSDAGRFQHRCFEAVAGTRQCVCYCTPKVVSAKGLF